jgi:hypothetical protein
MPPDKTFAFSKSLIGVSFFSSNILFWRESGYFEAAAEEKPLLHTWSLAVEEQFYLFFPIFLLLIWRLGRKKSFLLIALFATFSFLLSEWGWRNQATANFYLAPTRAWELLAGSICAFFIVGRSLYRDEFLSLVGLILILCSIFFYDERIPFPSFYSLLPAIGVCLIIIFASPKTLTSKILSFKPFVFIGLLSYSAYLWHQPLFAFARLRFFEPPTSIFIFLTCLSLLCGYLSWRFIESPFRGTEPLLASRSRLFSYSLFSLVLIGLIGAGGILTNGLSSTSAHRIALAHQESRISPNHGISSQCDGNFTPLTDCTSSEDPELLLWGDSFAMHLFHGLKASNDSAKIRQFTQSSCSPILGLAQLNPTKNKGETWAYGCMDFNEKVFSWLSQSESIEFVVLSSPFGWVTKESTINIEGDVHGASRSIAISAFEESIRKIRELGVGVVVVSPTPFSDRNIGDCLFKKYQFDLNIKCDFSLDEEDHRIDFLKEASSFVPVYWLHNDICNGGVCYAAINDTLIYQDEGHLTREGSAFLGKTNHWYTNFRQLADRTF